MGKNITTVMIGIPVYNESENILALLASIFRQQQQNWKLDRILIISDGSTDETVKILYQFLVKHKMIQIINHRRRIGKAARLNEIYARNRSDYLLSLDGDIVFGGTRDIEEMIEVAKRDQNTQLVAGQHRSVGVPRTLFQFISHTNYDLWTNIRSGMHSGDSIYNVYGSASLVTRAVTQKLRYPQGLVCDQGYLYAWVKKYGKVQLARKSVILQRPVGNWYDFRLTWTRSLSERDVLTKYFGKVVDAYYFVPLLVKFRATIEMFMKRPFLSMGAIAINILVRLFPINDDLNKIGLWHQARSTKRAL